MFVLRVGVFHPCFAPFFVLHNKQKPFLPTPPAPLHTTTSTTNNINNNKQNQRCSSPPQKGYAADDTQCCRNLTLVLAHCYACGLLGADCLFSFLARLAERFAEQDVLILSTLLHAVGLKLRADDPAAMKVSEFFRGRERVYACGRRGASVSVATMV